MLITKEQITQILNGSFLIERLDVVDLSHLHAGHAQAKQSGGGHFSILIVSTDFAGKTLVERHRMIHQALQHELKTRIHALSIKALTPDELV